MGFDWGIKDQASVPPRAAARALRLLVVAPDDTERAVRHRAVYGGADHLCAPSASLRTAFCSCAYTLFRRACSAPARPNRVLSVPYDPAAQGTCGAEATLPRGGPARSSNGAHPRPAGAIALGSPASTEPQRVLHRASRPSPPVPLLATGSWLEETVRHSSRLSTVHPTRVVRSLAARRESLGPRRSGRRSSALVPRRVTGLGPSRSSLGRRLLGLRPVEPPQLQKTGQVEVRGSDRPAESCGPIWG